MEHIDQYLQYLRSEKRMSVHTIEAYRNDLVQFRDHLVEVFEEADLLSVKTPMVRSWLASLREKEISARSVNRKRSALSSFYRYARRTGWTDQDPVKGTSAPKVEKRLPVYVDERGMALLLDQQDAGEWEFAQLRDYLILVLLYETGLRQAELISMNLDSIDYGKSELKVLGKRNKERVIPLRKETLSLLQSYLPLRREIAPPGSVHLLCTDAGRKLYPKFVYRKVNTYLRSVTTLEKRSPHVLRHTFATHMLNNGAQLNTVKELLGHASLSATQVYTHNSIEKLKRVHEASHPKG